MTWPPLILHGAGADEAVILVGLVALMVLGALWLLRRAVGEDEPPET